MSVCRARVYQYYLPIYLWLHHQLQQHQQTHPDTPLFVGMSAPQGSGKTTICEELQHLLAQGGYQAVFASLDDFYLTYDDQQALAKVCVWVACASHDGRHKHTMLQHHDHDRMHACTQVQNMNKTLGRCKGLNNHAR